MSPEEDACDPDDARARATAGAEPDARRARRTLRRLALGHRLGLWLQLAWVPGPLGLVLVTAAGVVAGGPQHRGMPLHWTPLISVCTAATAGGVALAAAGTLLRMAVAGSSRRRCRLLPVARELHRRAAAPPPTRWRLGGWRIQSDGIVSGTRRMPTAVRLAARFVAAAAAVLVLGVAALATPAVLAAPGGGLDLLVAAAGGLGILVLVVRRVPAAWRCDAARLPASAGRCHARVGRTFPGVLLGRRRLVVRHDGARSPILVADLPPWPASAVARHRLASVLPRDLAAVVAGGPPGDADAIPGDRGLPPAQSASTGSSSSSAMTSDGSARAS